MPGGRYLPTAGLSRVGVLPTHRRQGILTAMMGRHLRQARDRGDVLGSLRAAEAAIYGRFGYGMAALAASVRVPTHRSEFVSPVELSGTFEVMQGTALVAAAREAYGRCPGRPGHLVRAPWIDSLYFHEHGEVFPAVSEWGVVHFDRRHRPDGFARWQTVDRDHWHERGHRIEVSDLFGATADVEAGLWRFLFDLDLVEVVTCESQPARRPGATPLQGPAGVRDGRGVGRAVGAGPRRPRGARRSHLRQRRNRGARHRLPTRCSPTTWLATKSATAAVAGCVGRRTLPWRSTPSVRWCSAGPRSPSSPAPGCWPRCARVGWPGRIACSGRRSNRGAAHRSDVDCYQGSPWRSGSAARERAAVPSSHERCSGHQRHWGPGRLVGVSSSRVTSMIRRIPSIVRRTADRSDASVTVLGVSGCRVEVVGGQFSWRDAELQGFDQGIEPQVFPVGGRHPPGLEIDDDLARRSTEGEIGLARQHQPAAEQVDARATLDHRVPLVLQRGEALLEGRHLGHRRGAELGEVVLGEAGEKRSDAGTLVVGEPGDALVDQRHGDTARPGSG